MILVVDIAYTTLVAYITYALLEPDISCILLIVDIPDNVPLINIICTL